MADKVLYYKIEVESNDVEVAKLTLELKLLTDQINKAKAATKDKATLDANATAQLSNQIVETTRLRDAIKDRINVLNGLPSVAEKAAQREVEALNKIKEARNKLEEVNTKRLEKAAQREVEALNKIKEARNKLEQAYTISEDKKAAKAAANTFEDGSIAKLRQDLSATTAAYDRLGAAERNAASGKAMEQSIQAQIAELNKLEQATGRFQRNVGNYKSGFNGLANSINQISREMPAFAFSVQTGFLALSNNIPILVDEINNLKLKTAQLKAEGKETIPVWQQIAKGLFSWQTAMSVGITLIVMYGQKVIDYFFGISEATKQATEDAENYSKSLQDAQNTAIHNAIKDKDMMDIWVTTAQNVNATMENRLLAIKKLQETYPETFGSISTETLLYGNLTIAIQKTTEALFNKAKADANIEKAILADQKANDLIEMRNKLLQPLLNKYKQLSDFQRGATGEQEGLTFGQWLGLQDADIANEANDLSIRIKAAQEDVIRFKKEAGVAFESDLAFGEPIKNDKSAEDKLKKDKDLAEMRIELRRQFNNELIQLEKDQTKREIDEETYRHYNQIEDYKAKQKEFPELKKEYDALIESENKTHVANIEKINNDSLIRQSEAQREFNKKQREQTEENKKQALKDKEEFDNLWALLYKSQQEDIEKKEKEHAQKVKEISTELRQFSTNATNQYFQMANDSLQRHLKNQERVIKDAAETENNALLVRLNNGQITESQYQALKLENDKKAQEASLKAQKDAFEKEKKLAKAQIAVNTAIAISYALVGSKANIALAAVKIGGILAISAAQLAAVNAQEFATGGLVLDEPNISRKSNGDSILATLTPGEVVLNKSQQAALGGSETFSKIGVPGFPKLYPNSSGGSVSGITKNDLKEMVYGFSKVVNDKKVINIEGESKRVRDTVQNYESNAKW